MPRSSKDLMEEIQLMQSMMPKGNALTQSFDPQRAMIMQLVMERARGEGRGPTSRLGQAISRKFGNPLDSAIGGVKNALNAPFDALADLIDPPPPGGPQVKPAAPAVLAPGGWFETEVPTMPAHINDEEKELLGNPPAVPFESSSGNDDWLAELSPEEMLELMSLGGSGDLDPGTGLPRFESGNDNDRGYSGGGDDGPDDGGGGDDASWDAANEQGFNTPGDDAAGSGGPGGPGGGGGSWFGGGDWRWNPGEDKSLFGEDNTFSFWTKDDKEAWNSIGPNRDTLKDRGALDSLSAFGQGLRDQYMLGKEAGLGALDDYFRSPESSGVFDFFAGLSPGPISAFMGLGALMGQGQKSYMAHDMYGMAYKDLSPLERQSVDAAYNRYQAEATEQMLASPANGWNAPQELPGEEEAMLAAQGMPPRRSPAPVVSAWEPSNPLLVSGSRWLKRKGSSLI